MNRTRKWGRRLFVGILLVVFGLLISFGVRYERGAEEVLSFADEASGLRDIPVRRMGSVEEVSANSSRMWAAVIFYQAVIEKYPFSFASVKAKERLVAIESKTGIFPSMRIEESFAEESFGWFNPYSYYGFPVFACFVCLGIFVIAFLSRACLGRPMKLVVFSSIFVVGMLVVQFIDAGELSFGEEFASECMRNPRWLFWASGAMLLVCAWTIWTLSGKSVPEEVKVV